MPWSNQSGGGGPWGGGGNDNGPKGPWGQGPRGSGGGPTPPDLEDLLRRSQDRLKSVLPGGGFNGRVIALIGAALVVIWALTGWYRVQPDEIGVNLVFGKFSSLSNPGLNYNFPYPIGAVMKPRVTAVNSIDVGLRSAGTQTGTRNNGRDEPSESLMLTGDENIVDLSFSVTWRVSNPGRYLFNISDPDATLSAVAESAMREVIGRSELDAIISRSRGQIQIEVAALMQRILDGYGAGIIIDGVQISDAGPPKEVVDAFRDVNNASQNAESRANQARGTAAEVIQQAKGYQSQVVREAAGEAARFNQVYAQYKLAPGVTRDRLYIETMERVLTKTNKVIIDNKGASAPIILPPDVFRPRAAPQPSSASATPALPQRVSGGTQ